MLIFTIKSKDDPRGREIRHEEGPIEIGRGEKRELPRIVVADQYTSRHQLRVEELPIGDVQVINLGGPVILPDGTQLPAHEPRALRAPTKLTFGYTILEIGVIPKESDDPLESSLHTISRPLKSNDALRSQLRSAMESAPPPEVLAEWFTRLLSVQKAAAGSDEFYQETARAVVELIGLDRGMVLLRDTGPNPWRIVARHSTLEKGTDRFSRRVVEQVVGKRSTSYQMYDKGNEGGSLEMVDAVVASPIFDGRDEVVGVVYGSRDMRSFAPTGRRGIQPLEAQLVQVLAGAVSAGLARVEREAEAARTRVQFEQWAPPELVQRLVRDAGLLIAREQELTLLFADLRGFSRISERIGAEETYNLLSDILDRFTNQIMDHGGVVIDYYGDGLAAMWNAPILEHHDHAERAVNAAQAIQRELPEINVTWAERLQGMIRIGIGIHTGVAQVGDSGSKRKRKYGPRGHAVNLASRVEASTKVFGVPCVITEATRAKLPADLALRRLCRARLTGMDSAINLYELPSEAPSTPWLMRRDLYEQALALYEQDMAASALELVSTLQSYLTAQDAPTQMLQVHARARQANPEAPFELVFNVETKT